MTWIETNDNAADAITGDRIGPGVLVFDTGKNNGTYPFDTSRTRLVKEETIVWLAEAAGYTISRNGSVGSGDDSVAAVPEPAPVVEREDAGVGDGEGPVRDSKAGGSKAPRRANGKSSRK